MSVEDALRRAMNIPTKGDAPMQIVHLQLMADDLKSDFNAPDMVFASTEETVAHLMDTLCEIACEKYGLKRSDVLREFKKIANQQ